MPKIDLLEKKGKLSDWAAFRLMSVMLYPKNMARREDYILWAIVQEAYERKKSGWTNSKILKANHLETEFEKCGGLKRLLDASSRKDIKIESNKSVERGSLAGEIVFGVLKFHKDPKAPDLGVNKTTQILELLLNKSSSLKGRIKSRTIYNYWKEFKEVSHLWCALRILYKGNINKLRIITNVPALLGLSEEIRSFGEAYKWHPNEPALLSKGKTYTPPKDYTPPPVELKSRKVERWLLDIIKK